MTAIGEDAIINVEVDAKRVKYWKRIETFLYAQMVTAERKHVLCVSQMTL